MVVFDLMSNHESENESKLPETPGSLPQEPVEARPNVGQVSPDNYPEPANAVDVAGSGRGEGPGESSQNYAPGGTSVGAAKTDEVASED
ncbi:hypothetical protein G7076_02660 [Sphingomonas sp. HDW15A]|uniref:hypothetical protein n=1 Tax=Sphingomonas sp. HDW15A TaxID=2714942 RepID=UPI00140A849F|nr:hypothetical protein [Sphingomonas sp. HDW15A]QIK95526.1 hypothetical protein G7076_02660 [Sphingomonas sp. HDW15A]